MSGKLREKDTHKLSELKFKTLKLDIQFVLYG